MKAFMLNPFVWLLVLGLGFIFAPLTTRLYRSR